MFHFFFSSGYNSLSSRSVVYVLKCVLLFVNSLGSCIVIDVSCLNQFVYLANLLPCFPTDRYEQNLPDICYYTIKYYRLVHRIHET